MLSTCRSGILLKSFTRPNISHCVSLAYTQTRAFASVLPEVPTHSKVSGGRGSTPSTPTPEGHLRPHLGIKIDPNHGLYGFFRRVEKDGKADYDTLEVNMHSKTGSGRSWSAAELRRKSFKDLHTLWYVLLRERNLLATQRGEGKRLAITPARLGSGIQSHKVRKSMARIKYVINERRLAYEGAVKILESRRQTWADKEAKEAARRQRLAQKRSSKSRLVWKSTSKERLALKSASESKERSSRTSAPQIRRRGNRAEDLAAAGLFASPTEASQSAKRS